MQADKHFCSSSYLGRNHPGARGLLLNENCCQIKIKLSIKIKCQITGSREIRSEGGMAVGSTVGIFFFQVACQAEILLIIHLYHSIPNTFS